MLFFFYYFCKIIPTTATHWDCLSEVILVRTNNIYFQAKIKQMTSEFVLSGAIELVKWIFFIFSYCDTFILFLYLFILSKTFGFNWHKRWDIFWSLKGSEILHTYEKILFQTIRRMDNLHSCNQTVISNKKQNLFNLQPFMCLWWHL